MWGAIIGAVVSLYTNYQARKQQQEGIDAAAARDREGAAAQQAAIEKAKVDQAPALAYLQNVVSQGDAITPGQRQYAADTRQQTGSLLASRLGGRAATAIASRAAIDVNNNALAENRQRADTAALHLANPNVNGASLSLATGQLQMQDADRKAQAARDSAALAAGATTAAGTLVGQSIGQYYSGQSTQDLLDAIRSNGARTSNYQTTTSKPDTEWSPSYSLTTRS